MGVSEYTIDLFTNVCIIMYSALTMVQYSTVQYSTVQYSTVDPCVVWGGGGGGG
jgi:hypothetical protein